MILRHPYNVAAGANEVSLRGVTCMIRGLAMRAGPAVSARQPLAIAVSPLPAAP
jgi:hypothetical protein